jgi:carbamoyl-phosphate synthase large subunit
MKPYKCLKNKLFTNSEYSLVPIRFNDRFKIMNWRNDQIYHLRQEKYLTKTDQDSYFSNVINTLFEQETPGQILFSYLRNDECIGYGGLVNINWVDKIAEISFVMKTDLQQDFFQFHWTNYLGLIEKVAFEDLNFHKIFTYAFDLRPHLYPILEKHGFYEEAVLKEHGRFGNNRIDVIIHSKFNCFNNYILGELENYGNFLITSISRKTSLIETVKKAANKINSSVKVIGADYDNNCIGKYFVDEFWHLPQISEISIDDFIAECKKRKIRIVIPTRDGELIFFSKNKLKFKANKIHVMVSDYQSVEKCLDKYKFSNNNGEFDKYFIPTYDTIQGLEFKRYVVKERFGAGSLSIGVNLTKEEAIKHSKNLDNPVFQEFIPGNEISIDAYIDLNTIIKGIVIRERNLVINGESYKTTTIDKRELEIQFVEIINHLKLYGHVVLQAIIDQNDKINIIECNSRFGGASSISTMVGLDSFYWTNLESMDINIDDKIFKKSNNTVTQIKYIKDLYI